LHIDTIEDCLNFAMPGNRTIEFIFVICKKKLVVLGLHGRLIPMIGTARLRENQNALPLV
jgi:hypothetical protein